MMSSSNPRNTPNLSVPLTQTTAPVTKFRCLFTHDLRRKAKRWHDGFLRFHTFNKRVMVYDSSSNFIGDLHWRETEDVQDGDEMELDKGVLIQVGECIGRTETDLTPILLDKRKQDQASPPKEPPRHQPSHTPRPQTSARPQQRDTSLSAILGIKRSSIGNLLPTESHSTTSDPATHIFTANETEDRPRKRRRETPENIVSQQNNSNGNPHEPRIAKASEVPRREISPSKTLPRANLARRADQELAKPVNLVSRPAVSEASHSTSNREPTAPTGLPRNSLPPNPGSTNSQDAQFSTLRISTQKPRKKLMYSALLPQNGSQSGTQKRQRPASNLDSSVGLQNAQPGYRSYPTDIGVLSDLIDEFSSDDYPEATMPSHVAHADNTYESPSDTALAAFVDLIRAEGSPTPQVKASPNSINSHNPPPLRECQEQVMKPASIDSRNVDELRTKDNTPQVITKQPRQFLRSHSETGALKGKAPTPFPRSPPLPPQRQQPTHRGAGQAASANAEPSPTKRTSPRLFQRSISDLSSLRQGNSKRSHAIIATGRKPPDPIPEENEDDQGPWTSEALDLFDWWPPGKPKPASEAAVS